MKKVISAFDTPQQAQRVLDRLLQEGFDRADVHVERGRGTGTPAKPMDEDRGVLSSIGHFFVSLFGQDDDDGQKAALYSEAVRRGSSVVVVSVRDEEEADRAALIMQELGAMDVEERAEEWRQDGWVVPDARPTLGAERVVAKGLPTAKETERERAMASDRESVRGKPRKNS
jgi:hypothetical protein